MSSRREMSLSRRDDYRQNAWECLRWAQTASDPHDKATFLQMARSWTRLAAKVATIDSLAELAAKPASAIE